MHYLQHVLLLNYIIHNVVFVTYILGLCNARHSFKLYEYKSGIRKIHTCLEAHYLCNAHCKNKVFLSYNSFCQQKLPLLYQRSLQNNFVVGIFPPPSNALFLYMSLMQTLCSLFNSTTYIYLVIHTKPNEYTQALFYFFIQCLY